MSLRLLGMLEATAVKSHQRVCLNTSWTKTRAIDILKLARWMWWGAGGLDLYKELQTSKKCWEQEKLSAPVASTAVGFPILND